MGEQTQHFSVFPLWDLASPSYTGAVPLYIAMLLFAWADDRRHRVFRPLWFGCALFGVLSIKLAPT